MERNQKIDILRGIAIISMVMGHSMGNVYYLSIPFNFIYSFHMPLLFFLSGYLVELNSDHYRNIGIAKFLKKKAISLLLPYFVWTVVIPWILNGFSLEILKKQLINVLGLEGGGIWFLPVLFGIMVTYALWMQLSLFIMKNIDNLWKDLFLVVIDIFILLLIAIATRHPYLINMLSYSIVFFGGVLLKKYNSIEQIILSRKILILSVIFYMIFLPFFNFYEIGVLTQLKRIFLSGFMAIILWNLDLKKHYENRFIKLIMLYGRYSLTIYLLHGYLGKWKIILTQMSSVVLAVIVSFLMSILVCAICVIVAKLLKKNKYIQVFLLGK